jgi:mannose-6-phosphate isomerase-like protein (cupin superfamily)
MGKVVTFASLSYRKIFPGVKQAPITGNEAQEMAAEMLHIAPGAQFTATVPQRSDRYFFALKGGATLTTMGQSHNMQQDTFAALQEGIEFMLANSGNTEAEILSVTAPPEAIRSQHAGFAGGVAVSHPRTQPIVEIPEQKKRRIYLVDKSAAQSERAHAMIVLYENETVTNMHLHPNAESMFVILTGKVRFTVNGEDVVIERGQATHFPVGDRHGLRVADGNVSFLEFHIPAQYTTVRG